MEFSVLNLTFHHGFADGIAESMGGMSIAVVIDFCPGDEIVLPVYFYRETAAFPFHAEFTLTARGLEHCARLQVFLA